MRLFNFKKKQKPVVITIHGFGKRMHHQFDSISDFLRKNGYDVMLFKADNKFYKLVIKTTKASFFFIQI